MSFDAKTITLSGTVKLLGITLDTNLNGIYKIFVTKQITKPKLFSV